MKFRDKAFWQAPPSGERAVRSHFDNKKGKEKIEGDSSRNNGGDIRNLCATGGSGAEVNLSAKGKYGIMTKCKPADGKVRTFKFWYTMK